MQAGPELHLLHMPTRDGTRLATALYMPPAEFPPPWPVALTRTPYSRYDPSVAIPARRYAEAGFLVAVQDVRGRYDSEGEFWPFVNEPKDGYDAVSWLANHEDSDGRVITFGISYGAWTQVQLATQNPPGLAAMIPTYGPLNGYRETFYDGGIPQLWWVPWLAELSDGGRHPTPTPPGSSELLGHTQPELIEALWQSAAGDHDERGYRAAAEQLSRHATYDGFWSQPGLGMDEWLDRFPEIPILWVGGWYDFYPRAACEGFTRLTKRGNQLQHLLIGPWEHEQWDDTQPADTCNEVAFGTAADRSILESEVSWAKNALDLEVGAPTPPVSVFVMGDENSGETLPESKKHFEGGSWRKLSSWPPATDDCVLHLAPGGRLIDEASKVSGREVLVVDPARPAPTIAWSYVGTLPSGLAPPWNAPAGPRDVAKIQVEGVRLLDRPDCLAFWSEPLGHSISVLGEPRLRLLISSNAEDTDVVATLCKHSGGSLDDGYLLPVSFGVLRASHREGSEDPIPLVPHNPTALELPMTPTAITFAGGTQVGLIVTGSSFPRLAPNPQVFGFGAATAKAQIATNAVHVGPEAETFLILPVERKD
jgi:hypothetical protein